MSDLDEFKNASKVIRNLTSKHCADWPLAMTIVDSVLHRIESEMMAEKFEEKPTKENVNDKREWKKVPYKYIRDTG